VTFIVFAPAQKPGATVTFQGAANSPPPGVTVVADTSNPGGPGVAGGPHNDRKKINALFADWHAETIYWIPLPPGTGPAFTNASDSDAPFRWSP
jgi:prepilin-type processing-associated H-X9-DG protein